MASHKAIQLIKQFEGTKLEPYLCPADIWTIGTGHVIPDRNGNQIKGASNKNKIPAQYHTITEQQADELLEKDLIKFERGVVDLTNDIDINENEKAALISFAFNLGLQSLADSTLLRLLKQNKRTEAANEFLKWDKSNGKQLAGLTRRRVEERNLFLSNV